MLGGGSSSPLASSFVTFSESRICPLYLNLCWAAIARFLRRWQAYLNLVGLILLFRYSFADPLFYFCCQALEIRYFLTRRSSPIYSCSLVNRAMLVTRSSAEPGGTRQPWPSGDMWVSLSSRRWCPGCSRALVLYVFVLVICMVWVIIMVLTSYIFYEEVDRPAST